MLQHSCPKLCLNSRLACHSCIQPPGTSVTIVLDRYACLLEFHLLSRYVWNSYNWLASTSLVVRAEPADISVTLTCLRPTVMSPMPVPDQRAGTHSCTIPSGMYVTVVPSQQPYLYKLHTISMHVIYSLILCWMCTWPSAMYVTVASDHLPCQPTVMSVKLAPTRMHVWYTCTGSAFILVIAISHHIRFLLPLHQASKEVMVVKIASDEQTCILQCQPSSSNVFNSYT